MRGVKVIPLGPQVATLMRKRKGGASSTTNSSKSGSAVPKVRLSDISNGSLSIAVLDYNNANAITEELQNKTIRKGSLNGYSSNKNTKRVKSNSDSESFGNWFGNEGVESVSHTTHAALSATTASQTDVDVSPKSEKRENLKLERTPASRQKNNDNHCVMEKKNLPPRGNSPNDKVLRLSRLKEKDTCPIPNEAIEGDVKAISTGIQVVSLPSRRKKVASNTTNASKSESAVPKVRLSDISNGSLSIAVLDYDNANAITEELQNKTKQNGSLNGSSSDTMTDSVKNDNESVENWFGNEDIGLNSAVSRKLNVKSIWRKIHDLKIKLERIIANRQMELFRKAVHNGESNSILRNIKLPKSRILDILRRLKDNSNHEAPMLKDEVYLCMLRIAKKLMRIKEEKMLYRRFREGCQLTKAERHRLMSERRLICRIKKLNYL